MRTKFHPLTGVALVAMGLAGAEAGAAPASSAARATSITRQARAFSPNTISRGLLPGGSAARATSVAPRARAFSPNTIPGAGRSRMQAIPRRPAAFVIPESLAGFTPAESEMLRMIAILKQFEDVHPTDPASREGDCKRASPRDLLDCLGNRVGEADEAAGTNPAGSGGGRPNRGWLYHDREPNVPRPSAGGRTPGDIYATYPGRARDRSGVRDPGGQAGDGPVVTHHSQRGPYTFTRYSDGSSRTTRTDKDASGETRRSGLEIHANGVRTFTHTVERADGSSRTDRYGAGGSHDAIESDAEGNTTYTIYNEDGSIDISYDDGTYIHVDPPADDSEDDDPEGEAGQPIPDGASGGGGNDNCNWVPTLGCLNRRVPFMDMVSQPDRDPDGGGEREPGSAAGNLAKLDWVVNPGSGDWSAKGGGGIGTPRVDPNPPDPEPR